MCLATGTDQETDAGDPGRSREPDKPSLIALLPDLNGPGPLSAACIGDRHIQDQVCLRKPSGLIDAREPCTSAAGMGHCARGKNNEGCEHERFCHENTH